MFSTNHIIWIIICLLLTIIGIIYIHKLKPSFIQMFNFAFVVCVISEITKVLSVVKLIPIAGKDGLYPYLETNHLPLHLCSLQLLFISYFRFSKKRNNFDNWLVSFMYPTCMLGGLFAILLPSIFSTSINVSQAFTHPLAYQTFLFHTMLIILGYYLFRNKEIEIKKDGYKKAMILIIILGFTAIYTNSIFSTPIYENGVLTGVNHTTNFFFVSLPPIAISFSQTWHWYLYLLILAVLAFSLVGLLYIPIFKRNKQISNITI